ncbi:L-histidine N(alpha)-methyltransferase [Gordonia jinhuaensis]|uniref:Histidine N-alpha-methyltransferase n=1 Tax=Gordonia jinhuaensis TaxID=1517702 RepID=A0A916WV55_9ACTN|nr:L-histidine N(alpha)-methyltransferase [Gordonia jinhuaensis]GGB35145.1 histidine N-alpha-methyltransferase [Gordonia jinhuaensis]
MSTPVLEIMLTDADVEAALRADVAAGLTGTPKTLPPRWFYDAAGSELFEQITRLPEYYPTRTERGLLAEAADEIVAAAHAGTIIELGSGSSEKTQLLLDAGVRAQTVKEYVPQDVSVSALTDAVGQLSARYPSLRVHGMVSDFTTAVADLPAGEQRMVVFLGGTLGNFTPDERAAFLADLAASLTTGETLLLGVGLITDPAVMVAAYDDSAGVTARFNRNVLSVLDRDLHADFAVGDFDHVALWDPVNEWIEMRLRARRSMTVTVGDLGLTVEFAQGEQMRTEISAKFRLESISGELEAAGLPPEQVWVDEQSRFAVILARRS